MPPDLRQARQANDRAVMEACGSESACMVRLMKL